MLKFQNNNTTFSVNFEDFILIVFVIIDDLYKKYAPAAISHRIRISSAKLSDPEIITISICGELFGFDSENALILKMLCLIILIKTIDIYFQIFAAEADLIEPDEIFSNLQIYCFKNYNTFLILLTVHII